MEMTSMTSVQNRVGEYHSKKPLSAHGDRNQFLICFHSLSCSKNGNVWQQTLALPQDQRTKCPVLVDATDITKFKTHLPRCCMNVLTGLLLQSPHSSSAEFCWILIHELAELDLENRSDFRVFQSLPGRLAEFCQFHNLDASDGFLSASGTPSAGSGQSK